MGEITERLRDSKKQTETNALREREEERENERRRGRERDVKMMIWRYNCVLEISLCF